MTLVRIERGELSRCVLPWIVLMQGGDTSGSIELWRRLASAEPDARKRADYVGLLLVFAELVGRREVWERGLEDWNVVESEIIKKWQAKARDEGRREGAADALRAHLGQVVQARLQQSLPEEVRTKVATADLETLERWFVLALTVGSVDELRARINAA